MEIRFKAEGGKQTIIAQNEIQAAAFINQGLVPASKADADKLNVLNGQSEEVAEEIQE